VLVVDVEFSLSRLFELLKDQAEATRLCAWYASLVTQRHQTRRLDLSGRTKPGQWVAPGWLPGIIAQHVLHARNVCDRSPVLPVHKADGLTCTNMRANAFFAGHVQLHHPSHDGTRQGPLSSIAIAYMTQQPIMVGSVATPRHFLIFLDP
jgi:hypothetical protein